jgi:hypothetical protein
MGSDIECKAISELDLEPIKFRLIDKKSGEGWTLERACQVEAEYRRFLFLVKMYPNEAAAPLRDVDAFWHYHILDTMKYADDCDMVFGYFLHHFPYAGLRGEDDLAAHERLGKRTGDLYQKRFDGRYGAEPLDEKAPLAAAFTPAELAFCAAPATPAIAFCAAPARPRFAFCAAPAQPAGSHASDPAMRMHEFFSVRPKVNTHAST